MDFILAPDRVHGGGLVISQTSDKRWDIEPIRGILRVLPILDAIRGIGASAGMDQLSAIGAMGLQRGVDSHSFIALVSERLHDVFHVSVLKKYVPDPSHVISYEPLEIKDVLANEEVPVQILD
ncbi:uncharacterized protein LOC131153681 [Malania oleifera]|uniref:uncharacterized protein LOC131153681 n=1 Tax=Malania oleifera TaxID=397392 RepID=UPI0025ADB04A|nr:uncharacterized protein LOC131153681 [Malania oleifera]